MKNRKLWASLLLLASSLCMPHCSIAALLLLLYWPTGMVTIKLLLIMLLQIFLPLLGSLGSQAFLSYIACCCWLHYCWHPDVACTPQFASVPNIAGIHSLSNVPFVDSVLFLLLLASLHLVLSLQASLLLQAYPIVFCDIEVKSVQETRKYDVIGWHSVQFTITSFCWELWLTVL